MRSDWAVMLHRAFRAGVILKGVDGVLELLGGGALLLTAQPSIRHAVSWLTQAELVEDPGDFVANHLVQLVHHLSIGTQHFAGIYLIAHGAIKVGMVAGLLRESRWSFPLALVLLTAFIGYQCYRLTQTASIPLALLTVIDVLVVLLIAREWQEHGHRGHEPPPGDASRR